MHSPHSVCWHGKAWISPGLGIFLGRVGSHAWHSHMAHQITINLGARLTVNSQTASVSANAVCITAGVVHQIEADEILSIYLDALSAEARALSIEPGTGLASIQVNDSTALQTLLHEPRTSAQHIRDEVRNVLRLECMPVPDTRLLAVFSALNESLNDRQELAQLVHLSPTRFSHWFVKQTGLPLRSYRRWVRLIVALQHIASGDNLTQAAHSAGFADAAHFSHTFHSLFGIDPSSALGHVSLRG
ncbi:AraC family transcriptional regulator [Pseudomonas taeanensis MS-3]|uniref:AraC family transcriptional regulator n=2 Tax=Pseudomonas taeanensis TaxID=574962 RepID=A0A0A1YJD3_9PSED|nr:AraC family transcriptional regulator [Pseudomonas taeanensis MS-3]